MNVVKEIERINKKELEHGIFGGCGKGSWHDKYKDSAWVYVGGLDYELSEGDVICVMSQWGEIEDINLVRDKDTGKSQGFAFVKYEDQRSTIIAVDNFNGTTLLKRVVRCDHVDQYKLPKEIRDRETAKLEEDPNSTVSIGPGHAYKPEDLSNEYNIMKGQDLWAAPSSSRQEDDDEERRHKKSKKHKKHKHRSKDKSRDREREEEKWATGAGAAIVGRRTSDDIRHTEEALDAARAIVAQQPLPPQGSALSWRGKRDPIETVIAEYEKKKLLAAETMGRKREEFEGIAGMNRRR